MKTAGALVLLIALCATGLILISVLDSSSAEIVYVSEISRHGARAPKVLYNFTQNPEDNFQHSMQLTPAGRRQHFLIGHEIRNRYIKSQEVVGSRYDFREIEFFATDKDRALDSGISQISGIYPPTMPMQKLNDFQRKNALPPLTVTDAGRIDAELRDVAIPFNLMPIFSERDDINFRIHFEASNCPAYQNRKKELRESQEYLDLVAPYFNYLQPRLKELTGSTEELSLSDVNSICSYINIANFHKIPLIFSYNQEDLDNCQNFVSSKMFYIAWGDDFLWQIGSKVFYADLISAMNKTIHGEKQAKMQLHFSHDYMVAIVLNGLGKLFKDPIPFASTVFFELHKINSNYFVRTIFNDKPLTFGDCSSVMCPFDTFRETIQRNHPEGDIQDICNAAAPEAIPNVFVLSESSMFGGLGLDTIPNTLKNSDLMTLGKFIIILVTFLVLAYIIALLKPKSLEEIGRNQGKILLLDEELEREAQVYQGE